MMASWDGGKGGIPASRTSHGITLEVKPYAGESSSLSEEDEGLKDAVAETRWALVQVDALTGPSGCSDLSKSFLDGTVSRRGGDREYLLRPPQD